jgi:hypothetical protein
MQVQGADKARREIQSVTNSTKSVERALDGVRTSGNSAAKSIQGTGAAIKSSMTSAQREILKTSDHLKKLQLQSSPTFGGIIPRSSIGVAPSRGGAAVGNPSKIMETAKSIGVLSVVAERLNIPMSMLSGASKSAIAPLMGVVSALGVGGLAGVAGILLAAVGPLIISFEAVKKVFEVIGKAWNNTWTSVIKPVLDGLMKKLEPVFTVLQSSFEDLFAVFGALIVETMPAMVPIINGVVLALAGFVEFLAMMAKTIVKIYEATPLGFIQSKIRGEKFSDSIDAAQETIREAKRKAEREVGENHKAREKAKLDAALSGDTDWEKAGEKMAKGAKKTQRPKTQYDASRLLDSTLGWNG